MRAIRTLGYENTIGALIACIAAGVGIALFVVVGTGGLHDLGGVLLGFGLGVMPGTISGIWRRRSSMLPTNSAAAMAPGTILEINQIRSMKPGQEGYAVPWAMVVATDLRCFLNGSYTVEPVPHGTAIMRILRTGDGWHVFTVPGHHYEPSDAVPFVGGSRDEMIAVDGVD